MAAGTRSDGSVRRPAPAPLCAVLLALICCASLPPGGRAHGIMTQPGARNWLDYLNNNREWAAAVPGALGQ